MFSSKIKIKDNNLIIFLSFVIIALFIQFFATKSSPFYPFNNWVDPNAYLSMARGWLTGSIPYRDIFDHKGPLLYIFYMIGYVICSESFTGIYLIQSIFFATTLFFIYKISSLFLERYCSYAVAILFIPIFCSLNRQGGSAEEFIQPFQAILLYIFFLFFTKKEGKQDFKFLFFSGIIIGAITLIKFNIVIFCSFLLVPIILTPTINNNITLSVKYIIYVIMGIIFITAPFIFYFYLNDSLTDFIQTYILFNRTYGNSNIVHVINNFSGIFKSYIFCNLFILLGIIIFILRDFNKNSLYKISLSLAIISTYVSIYISNNTHIYSYIPLSIFSILLPLELFTIIQHRINKSKEVALLTVCAVISLSTSFIFKKKMINHRSDYLFEIDYAQHITAKKDNTVRILQLSLDRGLLFLTNSTPHYKYFYRPNISYESYPELYKAYISYINSSNPPHFVLFEKKITIKQIKLKDWIENKYLEELLNTKYNLIKEHIDYEIWPATGYYLYELKKDKI